MKAGKVLEIKRKDNEVEIIFEMIPEKADIETETQIESENLERFINNKVVQVDGKKAQLEFKFEKPSTMIMSVRGQLEFFGYMTKKSFERLLREYEAEKEFWKKQREEAMERITDMKDRTKKVLKAGILKSIVPDMYVMKVAKVGELSWNERNRIVRAIDSMGFDCDFFHPNELKAKGIDKLSNGEEVSLGYLYLVIKRPKGWFLNPALSGIEQGVATELDIENLSYFTSALMLMGIAGALYMAKGGVDYFLSKKDVFGYFFARIQEKLKEIANIEVPDLYIVIPDRTIDETRKELEEAGLPKEELEKMFDITEKPLREQFEKFEQLAFEFFERLKMQQETEQQPAT